MDVEKAFSVFLSAIESGDYSAAAEHGAAVAEWMERGGFLPAVIADIVDTLADERDSVFPFPGCIYDETAELEFRVFIRPDGSVELCTGAPDYDIDHRGHCGAGGISPDDLTADIRAAVVAAFSDCVDTIAQEN